MKRAETFQFLIKRPKNFKLADLEHRKGTAGKVHRKPSQLESNQTLQDAIFSLDNRPTGSGKSFAIRFLAVHNTLKDLTAKCIVAAPTLQACLDFLGEKLELTFGNEYDLLNPFWNPRWDTIKDSFESSIAHVIQFLNHEGSGPSYNDRILVTTHASLVRAFQASPESFKNVLICIDEAHHVKSDDEDETLSPEEQDNINQLGRLVDYAIKTQAENRIRLHFTTATYIRGDSMAIISEEYDKLFIKFSMPYYRYLTEECQYLKSFTYTFNLYEKCPLESLMEEMKPKRFKKFIGYIEAGPVDEKAEKVLNYYRAISQSDKPRWQNNSDGTVSVWRGSKEYIGIELVEEAGRLQKYEYVRAAHDGDKPLDFIVALRTFIESANWRQAEKMYIIGYKSSVTQLLQMIGRLTRDCKGKADVEVVHILPKMFANNEVGEYIDKFDDFLKTLIMVMEQLPVVFFPKLPKEKQEQLNPQEPKGVGQPSLLLEMVGNKGEYNAIVGELDVILLKLWACGEKNKALANAFKAETFEVLSKYGIEDENITNRIAEEFLKNREARRKKFLAMNLGSYMNDLRGYKVVTDHKYVGDLLYLIGDGVTEKKLSSLREYILERFGDWEKRCTMLTAFYNEHGHCDVAAILEEMGEVAEAEMVET